MLMLMGYNTREGLLFFASTGRQNIIQISLKVLQLQKILSGSADKSRVNVPLKHETVIILLTHNRAQAGQSASAHTELRKRLKPFQRHLLPDSD